MIKRIIDFVRHGIWEVDEEGVGRSGWVVRPFKIALYTVRGIGEHNIFVRASSLTYYTLMSLVPIAALIFGFMKGFGFDANIWEWLYGKVPEFSSSLDYLREWVDNLLLKTRGGVIAAVGMVILFWSVFKVFTNVEDAFNLIWEVRKKRHIARMLSDYLSVVVVGPLLLISASALSSIVRSFLEPWMWTQLLNTAFLLAELILTWMLFVLVYWVMPNTKVKFKGALIAALFAGTAFWIFQKLYFILQGELNTYNAVYGTFAAIPLLLVWLQTSWILLLVGAEVSFAYQNIDKYEMERESVFMDTNAKRKILVASMLMITKHFLNNEGGVRSETIADELDLPVRSVRDAVYELGQAGLVAALKTNHADRENAYIPVRDVHGITVLDVIGKVENLGEGKLDMGRVPELKKVSDLLDRINKRTKESGLDTKLTELL